MRNGHGSRLLSKGERKFPYDDDDRVYKNRKHAVLKFSGEIAADPRIGTQDWPMAFGPAARHVGERGKNRQFIIVVPKNNGVVPEEKKAKGDNDCTSD